MTELDKETDRLADEITNEFIRLGCSTYDDPCSGLMVRVPNILTNKPTVDIYDDHTSGFYDARRVLVYLKKMVPTGNLLDGKGSGNIWQHLSVFEASPNVDLEEQLKVLLTRAG